MVNTPAEFFSLSFQKNFANSLIDKNIFKGKMKIKLKYCSLDEESSLASISEKLCLVKRAGGQTMKMASEDFLVKFLAKNVCLTLARLSIAFLSI